MNKYTDGLLFHMPNFLTGVSSLLNIFGGYQAKPQLPPIEADRLALESDWEMVGQDLSQAMESFDKQLKEERSRQLEFNFNNKQVSSV